MDTKAYSQLATQTPNNQLTTILTSSASGLLKGGHEAADVRRNLTPISAWTGGTNLTSAVRRDPDVIRPWLAGELARLVKDIGAKNSLYETEELISACDAIIEEFPVLKMEEVVIVFKQISRGKLLPKLYNSFRTRELLEAFRTYEGDTRAEVLERLHQAPKTPGVKRNSGSKPIFESVNLSKDELQNIGIWPESQPDPKQSES